MAEQRPCPGRAPTCGKKICFSLEKRVNSSFSYYKGSVAITSVLLFSLLHSFFPCLAGICISKNSMFSFMQHLRTSTVLVEILLFSSYSSCLVSGWADVFFFRISDLCCALAYNCSSVLKSWLVLCSIRSERCSLVCLREYEKPEASTWSVCCQTSASAANDLQCVWNSQE